MDEGTVNLPYLLAQFLFRHAKGRKQWANMFGGNFTTRLAEHFRLHTEDSLRGLTVVVRDVTEIDMDELVRLRICERLLEIPNWVAPRPERQQVDPAPIQTPEAPPAARFEEEVYKIRQNIVGLRRVVDRLITDQSRFATWMISC
ncbi:hypothetical protein Tco_0556540 [Tanacetum coccineum]